MAVTGKEPYRARADMSKANWGRYFAVVDGFTYDDVPHAPWVRHVDKAFPEENTGRNHGLTLAMLQLMPSLHPEAKWFLFTDDDTFVVPHQLLRLAASLDSSEPFMTGRVYAYPPDHQVWFVCGGSGILASRAFAERLAPRALGCRRTYNWEDYSDSKVGSCARDVFEAEGGASEPYVQSRDDFWNRPLEEAGVSEGLLPENAVITMHIKDVNRSQDIFRFFEKDLTAGRDIRWGDVARAVKGFGSSLK
uniref:N-acetylgalactosaminide beta-1,3-galactosyltransferase n=1 Tax=Alexandrium catenella TaxID=2925 RepID=A0A7S1WSJ4_ALECA